VAYGRIAAGDAGPDAALERAAQSAISALLR
jgi:hypothetical protein